MKTSTEAATTTVTASTTASAAAGFETVWTEGAGAETVMTEAAPLLPTKTRPEKLDTKATAAGTAPMTTRVAMRNETKALAEEETIMTRAAGQQ